jgi:beta-N-acetylhexosaminidase
MLRRFTAILLLAACCSAQKARPPRPAHLDSEGRRWVEHTLKKMSLEQKVGQMFMTLERVRFQNVESDDRKALIAKIQRYHMGGVVLSIPVDGGVLRRTLPLEAAQWTNRLQQSAETPLLISADFERGLGMRLNAGTLFPAAMAFGATGEPELAEKFGEISAEESRAIGVHWNFFPVADVNSNPVNPIINTRSFGEDPQAVGQFVAAYIRGAKRSGMLTTAKHFPGHGDTATDTHLAMAIVSGDRNHLDTIELPPFHSAISAGVDAVMVAHVYVPTLDADKQHVAITSPAVVTDLLKNQLGFHGVVVTDALDMNALEEVYGGRAGQARAALDALKAGADLLLQPSDLDAAYNGVLNAVRSGEISPARIDASVRKLLEMKASLGLHKSRTVSLEDVDQVVAKPENIAFGQNVSDRAVTLVRDNGQLLPLRRSPPRERGPLTYGNVVPPGKRLLVVLFTDDVRADTGRLLEREVRNRVPDATVIYVDPLTPPQLAAFVMERAAETEAIIAAVAISPSGGKMVMVNGQLTSTVGLADTPAAMLGALLQGAGPRTAVVALGSPYLAQQFPEVQNYLCTFSSEKVSESSAVKALFGEIAIHGRLPVTIPGIAARGAGMDRQIASGGQNASR